MKVREIENYEDVIYVAPLSSEANEDKAGHVGTTLQASGDAEASPPCQRQPAVSQVLEGPCFSFPVTCRFLHMSPLPQSLSRSRGRSAADECMGTAVLLSRLASP